MKIIATFLGTIALMVAGTAVAAEATNQDLLSAFTSDSAAVAAVMSASDLDSVRGEGTFERFFEVPGLHRDFSRSFTTPDGTMTISIVGVAGAGITLTFDSPSIP